MSTKPTFDNLPQVTLNTTLPPFKAWVQMAIPTVFDDSLSYSELLYKVINYLNTTNEHLTTNDETIKAFYDFLYGSDGTGTTDGLYYDITNWFNKLDVDTTLEAKVQSIMDEWVTDNTLLDLISPTVVNTTTTATNTWLGDRIHPETGYALDDSLLVTNAGAPAGVVGGAVHNAGLPYYDRIMNARITGSGATYSGSATSLFYRDIPLINNGENKITLYINKGGTLIYRICNVKTPATASEAIPTENILQYVVETHNAGDKIVIDYSQYYSSDTTLKYLSVSINATPSNLSITNDSNAITFFTGVGIIKILDDRIVEAERNIEENIEPLKNNSGLPAYDSISNARLSISGTPSITGSTSAILYRYIKLPKNSNSIIVYPTVTAGLINYAISKDKNINVENIVDTGTTQNMRVPLVVDYSSMYTDTIENLYLIISVFNSGITFDTSTDKTALLFMYDKGVLPNLIYGGSGTNANTAVNLLYNEFSTLVDTVSGFGITHIKNMAHNTRTYVYATNDNKTTVQNFIANSDETSPITIQAGHRYIFTKKHLYYRTLTNATYDVNAYYIEDLNDGVLKCGYLNNASADVPNDITWRDMGGGSNTINNTFNNTYNSYNTQYTGDINVTPQITSDTNNLLNPSGTDDTASILAMLQTGVCILNKGTFRISGLNMPDNSLLIGQGNSTVLIWSERESENPLNMYMINMSQNCTIENLMINAQYSAYNPFYSTSETVTEEKVIGNFSAIQFQPINGTTPSNCIINKVFISNCKGSGIKTYNTGQSPTNNIRISNVTITRCDCGINNSESSEFHKISNFDIRRCYYGCKITAGNVEYNNGTIYRCYYSVFIDAGSVNDSHGCFTDVRIIHTANVYGAEGVNGYIFFLRNFTHGEKFNGCSVGYGKIEINGCIGAKFFNTGFSHATITITNAVGALFSNCVKSNDVTVENTTSTKTKFINCFVTNGDDWNPTV